MAGRRASDWEALRTEYTTRGDDMPLEFLATSTGVSLEVLSHRAKAQNWGSVQAFYRAHMECVQETDIPERRSARRV